MKALAYANTIITLVLTGAAVILGVMGFFGFGTLKQSITKKADDRLDKKFHDYVEELRRENDKRNQAFQEHIGTMDKKLAKDISSLKEKLPEIIRAEIVKGKLE